MNFYENNIIFKYSISFHFQTKVLGTYIDELGKFGINKKRIIKKNKK